ncbi:hypothetical protein HD806DRAFT_541754 [Xylariaceae sp. AK1471]|nr:hypothetical protein HD806DRAFT_541754 [Xylariaceae sp. AK1471]
MGKTFKKGGGKNRRRGKKEDGEASKRELTFKEEGQEYARIEKVLGGGRYHAQSLSASTTASTEGDESKSNGVFLAIRRGAFRKKVFINAGDVVLLALRDFQPDKADIVHKYSADEVRKLQGYGEVLISALVENGNDAAASDEVVFEVDESGDDSVFSVHIDEI